MPLVQKKECEVDEGPFVVELGVEREGGRGIRSGDVERETIHGELYTWCQECIATINRSSQVHWVSQCSARDVNGVS